MEHFDPNSISSPFHAPMGTTVFIVSSFRPVVFVLDEIEVMKLDVPLSGEISQHQREGLSASNRNGETLSRAMRETQFQGNADLIKEFEMMRKPVFP